MTAIHAINPKETGEQSRLSERSPQYYQLSTILYLFSRAFVCAREKQEKCNSIGYGLKFFFEYVNFAKKYSLER
jgi:hypothetical protein